MLTRRRLLANTVLTTAAAATGSLARAQAPAVAIPSTRRIHQSVSRWCYAKIPLDDLCRASAAMGLEGIDLLNAEDYDVPARFGIGRLGARGQGRERVAGFERLREPTRDPLGRDLGLHRGRYRIISSSWNPPSGGASTVTGCELSTVPYK